MTYKHNNKFTYHTDMRVDTLPSGRTYFTPDGAYASLTTLLGKTSPNQIWLQKWKDRVGEEEAARISKLATDRGTLIHSYAEHHFNNEYIWDRLAKEAADVRQMTRDLISAVDSGVEEIYGQEQILWSNKLKYAGRTDMVGIWKGNLSIIDFKTSKKPKASLEIKDYFIQCAGYATAHNEMYNTAIDNIVVIITVENKPAQIFEKRSTPFLYALNARAHEFYAQKAFLG